MRPRALLLAGLLGLACGSDEGERAPSAGFLECAAESGIDFRTTLLPTEQGEDFKINLYDHGAGVAAGDVDGDGDDDLYFCNQLGPNALYRNDGGFRFTDVTEASGPIALADRISVSAALNDVDNDGDQDLFVATTRGGNALYRNDGKGRFTDVTEESGVAWVGHSQGATFFDADGDGDLDLLVTNTAQWTLEDRDPKRRYFLGVRDLAQLVASPVETNVFYRNDGKGRFTDATAESGLAGPGWGGDTAVFDIDGDGDLDVFVGNMFGGSVLFRNDGKGRFEDVTAQVLGRTPWGTVGAKTLDYDGDGDLDLYVVDMHSDMWIPFEFPLSEVEEERKYKDFFGPMQLEPTQRRAAEQLFLVSTRTRYEAVFFGNALYRNDGDGTFAEVSAETGTETFWPWGIGAGDFDGDGFEDVYLASGMGYPWPFWRNALLMNDGDGTFTDRCRELGTDPPPGGPFLGPVIKGKKTTKSSRSVAVADLDGDGGLDLVVSNFNDRPYLYRNRWPRRAWVGFRLQGTRGPRDAVGAVARVHAGGRVFVRQVQAAGGYLAQSSKTLHFGLGDAESIDRCEIRWPGGRVQVIEAPETNRVHAVVEPAE